MLQLIMMMMMMMMMMTMTMIARTLHDSYNGCLSVDQKQDKDTKIPFRCPFIVVMISIF